MNAVRHRAVSSTVVPTAAPCPPPFDAVLLISFGGPQGPDDIRPFLANVLRGRPIPPARIEEVARHYELFDGVSPITALTQQQAAGLRLRLERARELLRQTNMPILDVAIATGFTSHSYFAQSYRLQFGRPPSEERRTTY